MLIGSHPYAPSRKKSYLPLKQLQINRSLSLYPADMGNFGTGWPAERKLEDPV
jgi:hypothetical protein